MSGSLSYPLFIGSLCAKDRQRQLQAQTAKNRLEIRRKEVLRVLHGALNA